MKFKMIDGFPCNSFTNRLLTEMELDYNGSISHTVRRLFRQFKTVTGPRFNYDWEGEDCLVIKPTTFYDSLLFVGLDVDKVIGQTSFPVRDGKFLYYYDDGALKQRLDMGYEIHYSPSSDNRLKFGYCGQLFKAYREKVAAL